MYDDHAMAPLSERERREFKQLIKQLEQIRREMGWPQERLAELCGVTQAAYSRWLSSKSEPTSLALAGLQSRVPTLIAELKASQKKIEKIMKEIEALRGGE